MPLSLTRVSAALAVALVAAAAAAAAAATPDTLEAYMQLREQHLEAEAKLRFDVSCRNLTEAEQRANATIMRLKEEDYARLELDWPPSLPFADAKPLIERSELFNVLRKLPKGGMLHAHEMSMVDVSFFVQNGTYRDECYLYLNDSSPANGSLTMLPGPQPGYKRVVDLRAAAPGGAAAFDEQLAADLVLGPTSAFLNGIVAWERFQSLFGRIFGVYAYRPVFEAWLHRLCQAMLDDNVQYLELRQAFGGMYDLEHGHYTAQEMLDTQRAVIDTYRRRYPSRFSDVPSIWCDTRSQDAAPVYEDMEKALAFRRANNRTVLGYDLVGEEHTGHTALYFVPDVLKLRQAHNLSGDGGPDDLPFFFHAGESDWWFNRNVLDAVMMGTRRIGHGYSLGKHPYVRQMVRDADVAVEVCPISNRELLLLKDLRNHPAAEFVRDGVPFVLASDDPALYGYEAVSYDWYMALVSWDMDLASLKQLALNSIRYSGTTPEAKQAMMAVWQAQWDAFVAGF